MTRLLLFAIALLATSYAQNAHQLTRFVQEQNALRNSAIRRNNSHLARLSLANDFFSLDDLLDVVAAGRLETLTPDCSEDMHELIAARLGQFQYPEFAEQVWLPIRDSAGKFHQAILKGHIYFAGHYSECVQIDAQLTGRERTFAADYFKVDVDILFQANWKNGSCVMSDMGQVVGWSFGVCLPASCSSAELEAFFLADTAKHNPVCRIQRTNDSIDEVDTGFYVTISIMGVIFAACVLSGLADFFLSDYFMNKAVSRSFLWRIFMSFSLYSNVAGIFDTSVAKKDGQIEPIHCIRFFSMCWVVMGHLTGSIIGIVANPIDILDCTKDLTTEFILNAYFAVDSFFFVGGLLLTFLWFKNFHRNPKQTNSPASWAMLYVHRILRLSPPYFIMVLFYTFVFPQLYRNSPFNMNPLTQIGFCKETWWVEFTYMDNIIDNQKQCLGYSWYLATDMQIFFFTPLLILPLAFNRVIGFIVGASLLAVSSAINIFLVYHYHWPSTLLFLSPTDPEMTNYDDYSSYMYESPVTRCQVYIIGMLVGWFLQTNRRIKINPIINIILWIFSIALMLALILGLHTETTGHLLPVFWRAMYSAFSKPAWALVLSWIIISCYYGYGGPINAFMSWHIWIPLGRLSYCGYLVHYPMIYLVLAQVHDEVYFSSFIDYFISRYIPIIALTYFASIFWSACFEINFGKMEMIILGGNRKKVKPTEVDLSTAKLSNGEVEGTMCPTNGIDDRKGDEYVKIRL